MSKEIQEFLAPIAERLADFLAALDEAERKVNERAAEKFMGKDEAAEFLNISVTTLERRMALNDGAPRYIDGGKISFLRSELKVWRRQWRVGDQTGLEA